MKLALVVMVCVAALSPSAAWSWGCRGHEVVALIAEDRLSAHAKQQVDDILSGAQRGSEACTHLDDAMASFSTWPDDHRSFHRSWHFLDIPRGATSGDVFAPCPDSGCVTVGLRGEIATLKDSTSTKTEREIALFFVLHLVGDIHQPLHCTTNGDRGGNCLPVDYVADGHARHAHSTDGGASYSPNLHHVWDAELVERGMPTDDHGDVDAFAYAQDLAKRFKTDMADWAKEDLNVEGWAVESHAVADTMTYKKLGTAVPVEPAGGELDDCLGNNKVGKRMAKLGVEVDDTYADLAHPTIERQLAKAGTRLAMVLNDIWP